MISPLTEAVDNVPDSLYELCVRYAVNHLDILATVNFYTKNLHLKEGLTLPSIICEHLLEAYQSNGFICDDRFVNLFKNPRATHLRKVRLRNATITDNGLWVLVNSCPVEIDLQNCTRLTEASLDHINKKGDRLVSLSLGASVQFPPKVERKDVVNEYKKRGYILITPNLKKLTLWELQVPEEKLYFPLLLKPLKKLTYLDLSGCFDLGNLLYLTHLPNLTSLILYNVETLHKGYPLASIMKLKNLKHLDISQLNVTYGTYKCPNQILAALVENLPNLVSLDISGTNLAGTGVASESLKKGDRCAPTDIPGLKSRVDNPLEFLGLYKTQHGACRRHNIPAKKISGNANEEQVITALQAYIDRTGLLMHVLKDLFQLLRQEECENFDVALSLVLEAMDRYLHEKLIQTSGSAVLCFIAKLIAKKRYFKIKVKRHLIKSVINAVRAFQDDVTLARNTCLTLMHFNIPDDFLFCYEQLVLVLVNIISEVQPYRSREERDVLRYGVYLLNSLACQVDGEHKQLLGKLGTVDRMLAIINNTLQNENFDVVLEVAWSTLWNITDETFENCQRFIEGNGLELFLGCLEKFPRKEELLRNMMGLLGNVAEMKSLRPYMMTERFVPIFADLLESSCDGIEVSYNAAGVLVHLCSDGVEAWTLKKPRRNEVLAKIVSAIESWDLNTQRNINYRSFQPVFGLLRVTHTEECKYWAVWALANLTTVYRDKYCPFIVNEGGIELLKNVIATKHSLPAIKTLAKIVLHNCCRCWGRQKRA